MTKLSYSLRKYDYAMYLLHLEVRNGLAKVDPIIGEIPATPTSHGGVIRQVSEPAIVETPMQVFSSDVILEGALFRKTDVDTFVGILWNSCQELIAQSTKFLFEITSRTSEAIGNVTNAKDMNIWDAQIETVKKLEMRFDNEGNHGVRFYPSNPENMAQRMRETPPTPEQIKQMDELIKAKREEYYAKKRTRRLS